MLTQADLEELLTKMPGAIEASVITDRYRFIATVVSPLFHGEHEAERQAKVWDYLYPLLGDEGMRRIEFIFVNTPEEQAGLEGNGTGVGA
jgi:hypothetical protein